MGRSCWLVIACYDQLKRSIRKILINQLRRLDLLHNFRIFVVHNIPCMCVYVCMSPVSSVFHTVVTVNIGLKNVPRVRASFYNNRRLYFKGRASKFSFPFCAAQARLNFHALALTLKTWIIWGTRQVEAQSQIKAPYPFPPNKRRTDLGTLVVLSAPDSVTCISS